MNISFSVHVKSVNAGLCLSFCTCTLEEIEKVIQFNYLKGLYLLTAGEKFTYNIWE